MALPSSRRPAHLEEEEERQDKVIRKLKVGKQTAFFGQMKDWYDQLSKNTKKNLKKHKVISKATRVASSLNTDLSRLPPTWLRTLHDDYGIDFRWHNPTEKAKRTAIREAMRTVRKAYFSREINFSDMRNTIDDLKNGVLTPTEVIQRFGIYSGKARVVEKQEFVEVDEFKKKMIDLSKEPPPAHWTVAYMNGKHLPRVLKVHRFEDTGQTVIYYDYDPKIQTDNGLPIGTYMVHEGNNFLSWNRKMGG